MNPEESPFCSQYSLSLGEALIGTAPRTDVWLLIEYPYPHPAKGVEESNLSEQVKTYLDKFGKETPNSRLILIKKSNQQETERRQIYVSSIHNSTTSLHRFELNRYEEILDIDLSAAARNEPGYSDSRCNHPILLVCTNGKRDRCCAKYGLPLFEALANLAPEMTWQSSHVGGHRFAPNVITLPSGIYYGRLSAILPEEIVKTTSEGTLLLDHCRGRASLPGEAQAAEYYLRRQTGLLKDVAFRLVEIKTAQNDRKSVKFETAPGQIYTVLLATAQSDYQVIESCSTPEKRSAQPVYRLLEIK
jgi:hypothetical protein